MTRRLTRCSRDSVSNIGERLASVHREDIEADDLPEMESLFRIFSGARGSARQLLERQSERCKIQDVSRFQTETHWVIDRWWTKQEKIDAGAEETTDAAGRADIDAASRKLSEAIAAYDHFMSAHPLPKTNTREVSLGDTAIFKTFIGKRVLVKDVGQDDTKIPLFSANAIAPMGFVESSRITDFSHPAILWGIRQQPFQLQIDSSWATIRNDRPLWCDPDRGRVGRWRVRPMRAFPLARRNDF